MSANLSAVPKLQFFDNNGNPLVGGKLYTYAAGTTTPQATFTDASATTPNTNPIILDSRGEANVWLSATTYKFVLTDSTNATIWTVDNISNSLSLSQILAASGSAASPPYTFASDTDTGMYLAAVGQLGLTVAGTPALRATSTDMVLSTSGLDRVVINASGSVGIGTSTPGNRLQVSSPLTGTTPRSNSVLRVQSEATGRDVNIQLSDNVTNAAEVGMVSGALYFATAGNERMRIDTSGNVGIGTTTTSNGNLNINGAPGKMALYNAGTFNAEMGLGIFTGFGDTFGINARQATGILTFGTNNTERMRITAAGDVGIGTTTPNDKLDIASGNIRLTSGQIVRWVDSGVVRAAVSADASSNLKLETAGAERMRIAADGAQSSVIPSGSTLYPQFACRAWINFDGTAVTSPASMTGVRASGNVSSVLDNGTGDYTINFTTSMPDANYAVVGTRSSTTVNRLATVQHNEGDTYSASAVRLYAKYEQGGAGGAEDPAIFNVAVFR